MKTKKLFIILLISLSLVVPTNALAASKYNYSNNIYILDSVSEAQAAREREIKKSVETTRASQIESEKLTEDKTDLCNNPNFIKLLKLLKLVIYLLMLATAVALVIRCMLVLVKEMTSDKAEIDKAIKTVSSKIVLAVILFILPALFNWIFFTDNFITRSNTFFETCVKNMNDGSFLPDGDKSNGGESSTANHNNSGSTSNRYNTLK